MTANSRNVAIIGNNFNRMCCRARGAQTAVTTLAVDNVADWPGTGTIRVNGSATAVTYTSVTQATRAGGGATINGLSAAVTVTDTQLVHLNAAGHGILTSLEQGLSACVDLWEGPDDPTLPESLLSRVACGYPARAAALLAAAKVRRLLALKRPTDANAEARRLALAGSTAAR